MSVIPEAPPVMPRKQTGCKVVISSGKIEEGYCIIGDELIPGPVRGVYTLPGTQIFIDEMSASLFSYPTINAFIAVPKSVFKKPGESSTTVYSLQPLRKSDYEKYERKELTSNDISVRYIPPPPIRHAGTYGKVELYPTERIALKTSLSSTQFGDLAQDMVKEIAVYRLLKEISCLPNLYKFETEGKAVKLQFQLGTVLSEALPAIKNIQEKTVIMFRSAKCLRSSASQGIIHSDLKPQNMVISQDGNVQIIDWGVCEIDQSKNQKRDKNPRKQTLWWRAPELLTIPPELGYSNKIDIFSLGLIFIEIYNQTVGIMATNNELEHRRTLLRRLLNWDREQLKTEQNINKVFNNVSIGAPVRDIIKERLLTDKIFFLENTIPMPEPLADLISHMLEFNHRHRIDYDNIVIHPFFQNIKRESIPKLPVFINNMPKIENIDDVWAKSDRFGELTVKNRNRNKKIPRDVIFSWLSDISANLSTHIDKHNIRCSMASICLSWQLVDLLFLKKPGLLTTKNLQCYGAGCVLLATKMFEPYEMEINVLERYSDGLCSIKQLKEIELEILSVLNGNILVPTLYSYYSYNQGIIPSDKQYRQKFLTEYLRPDIYATPFSEQWKRL